jgi:hypothetical protein
MTGYTKLFQTIVTSSIWQESDPTRLVWITMLALANKNGVVEASVPGLANMAKVTMEKTLEALEVLASPDKFSRSEEFEGRRIEKVEGGWMILNHGKYREKLSNSDRNDYQRVKQKEYREKKRSGAKGMKKGKPLVGESQFVEMVRNGQDVSREPGERIKVREGTSGEIPGCP